MREQTPENRPSAPGALSLVQDFINSGHLDAAALVAPGVADTIRARHEAGDSQALLAGEYGLNRGFVSAVLRRVALDDELQPPDAAAAWLAARDLLPEGTVISDEELERLLEFRQLLRTMAAANNGQALEPGVVSSLDRVAASVPLVLQFGNELEPELRPIGEGADEAIGRLLAMVAVAMRDGTWQRLKRCVGHGCPFTFYDSSRNRTGTWCSMSVCGNRTKVRNYQKRARASREQKSRG
jgi:predicted RNA-binding Zn ribbon-like protein